MLRRPSVTDGTDPQLQTQIAVIHSTVARRKKLSPEFGELMRLPFGSAPAGRGRLDGESATSVDEDPLHEGRVKCARLDAVFDGKGSDDTDCLTHV